MSSATPISTQARPARHRLEMAAFAGVLLGAIFSLPAPAANLDLTGPLRAWLFFKIEAGWFPLERTDGPLAFLMDPGLVPGEVLIQIIWQFGFALMATAAAIWSTWSLCRRWRWSVLAGLAILALCSREAMCWALPFALVLELRRAGAGRLDWFRVGLCLGMLGWLHFGIWALGAMLLAVMGRLTTAIKGDVLAGFAGFLVLSLAGWSTLCVRPHTAWDFLQGGLWAVTELGWLRASVFAGALVLVLILAARRSKAGPLVAVIAALAGWASPTFLGTVIGQSPASMLAERSRAWSVLLHPERFEKRLLRPAWQNLVQASSIPLIQEQLGQEIVDAAGAARFVAILQGLAFRPGSAQEGSTFLAPNGSQNETGPTRDHRLLMSEAGFSVWRSPGGKHEGFSPWLFAKAAPKALVPALIEGQHVAIEETATGEKLLRLRAPARLVFGPGAQSWAYFTSNYQWIGSDGVFRVNFVKPDGTREPLLERGLAPTVNASDTEVQALHVTLPDNFAGHYVEITATPADPTQPLDFALISPQHLRDWNRLVYTPLDFQKLQAIAKFVVAPLHTMSLAPAIENVSGTGLPRLLAHLPATIVLAKPRDAVRLTGWYGFVDEAYTGPSATLGAVFTVTWFSGTKEKRQIFSRILKPKEDPADRGPQNFDVDLSELPAGVLELGIQSAVPGNNSFGWTFWGGIDVEPKSAARKKSERADDLQAAYIVGWRPVPAQLTTNEQAPLIVTVGNHQMLRLHAPSEAVVGVLEGRTHVSGRYGFADEVWRQPKGKTDGADFVILWQDHTGETELWRQHLSPTDKPADRGMKEFSFTFEGRGAGLLLFRTEPGPASNNYLDWTAWSDITVW